MVRLARLSKGTVCTCFEGEDDLFFHLATSGFDALGAELRARVRGSAPIREPLVDACEEVGSLVELAPPTKAGSRAGELSERAVNSPPPSSPARRTPFPETPCFAGRAGFHCAHCVR